MGREKEWKGTFGWIKAFAHVIENESDLFWDKAKKYKVWEMSY